MNQNIKKLLNKQDKSKSDYLLLIGYLSTKQSNPPDYEILCKLGENFEKKFGRSMYDLVIFKNKPLTLF